jgi:hypothetical protein
VLKAINVSRTGQMFCIIDKVGTFEKGTKFSERGCR